MLLHFDTDHAGDAPSSRLVRLAVPFAGRGDGLHFPLRPGTEVLCAFVNGDPHRPVIVGAVTNPEAPSAVTEPDAHRNRITTTTGILIELGTP